MVSFFAVATAVCLAQTAVPTPTDSSKSVAPLVDRVKDSVVSIQSTKYIRRITRPDPFNEYLRNQLGLGQSPARRESQQSLGSGFIVDKSGLIFTNNHVVAGADEVRVLLSDNRSFDARVVGSDPDTDVAVVRLARPPADLKPVTMGNSDRVRVGDYVLAIGNPLGLGQTVTMGIVSAKNRMLGGNIVKLEDFIQTDAAINQGNSGGPLFNFNGEVVGINSAILNPATAMNVGFAIPINLARRISNQILGGNGRVVRGFLGVSSETLTPEKARAMGQGAIGGALVNVVQPRSPAEAAGLRPNDVIVEIAGTPVTNEAQVRLLVASSAPGQTLSIKYWRGGRLIEGKARLGDRESGDGGSEILGVRVVPLPAREAQMLGTPGLQVVGVDARSASSGHLREGDLLVGVRVGSTRAQEASVANLKKLEQHVSKGGRGSLILVRDGFQIELTVSG